MRLPSSPPRPASSHSIDDIPLPDNAQAAMVATRTGTRRCDRARCQGATDARPQPEETPMDIRHLARAATVGMVALCASFAASAEPITLKLHHFLGPQAPAHTKMLAPWAERVEKASGGKVKIELYPSMTLGGKPPQLIRQVRDGVVDIIWTVNGYTAGLFPRSEAFELPFVHTNDTAATNLAMRDLFESDLKPEYGGVHVLFLHVHAGQAIHMVDKPVRKPEDFAGLKMRIPSRTGAWV